MKSCANPARNTQRPGVFVNSPYRARRSKNKIATINVLKGEKVMKEYNSENGAVLITTKKSDKKRKSLTTKDFMNEKKSAFDLLLGIISLVFVF